MPLIVLTRVIAFGNVNSCSLGEQNLVGCVSKHTRVWLGIWFWCPYILISVKPEEIFRFLTNYTFFMHHPSIYCKYYVFPNFFTILIYEALITLGFLSNTHLNLTWFWFKNNRNHITLVNFFIRVIYLYINNSFFT